MRAKSRSLVRPGTTRNCEVDEDCREIALANGCNIMCCAAAKDLLELVGDVVLEEGECLRELRTDSSRVTT